jgi:probable rRNA maturation factor
MGSVASAPDGKELMKLIVDQNLIPKEERLNDAVLHGIEKAFEKQIAVLPEGVLSVAFITDQEIQRLNRQYRNKDAITDVLSFSYIEDGTITEELGDVVISHAQAKRQMHDDDLRLELVDLIVHGILHVLGYDHEKPADAAEMFPKQDAIVHDSL